jgi:1,4-dihydroxy-2-naphthoyl-CoA hydrolase
MPEFPSYDEEVAAMMLAGGLDGNNGGGLPEWLGIRTVGVGPGWVESEIDVRTEMLNPFGAAHGAVLASLLDHVLGSAVFPVVPRGTWPASLEFKLNYLAPVREGVLRARGDVVVLRRNTAVVRMEATNDDKVVGAGLGTVSLQAPRQPR